MMEVTSEDEVEIDFCYECNVEEVGLHVQCSEIQELMDSLFCR